VDTNKDGVNETTVAASHLVIIINMKTLHIHQNEMSRKRNKDACVEGRENVKVSGGNIPAWSKQGNGM
jgi:hypothetical protein